MNPSRVLFRNLLPTNKNDTRLQEVPCFPCKYFNFFELLQIGDVVGELKDVERNKKPSNCK